MMTLAAVTAEVNKKFEIDAHFLPKIWQLDSAAGMGEAAYRGERLVSVAALYQLLKMGRLGLWSQLSHITTRWFRIQESRAVARKPSDAAAVLFWLKVRRQQSLQV